MAYPVAYSDIAKAANDVCNPFSLAHDARLTIRVAPEQGFLPHGIL